MMTQPTLFSVRAQGAARRRDPLTSKRAARAVDGEWVTSRIREHYADAYQGLTAKECARRIFPELPERWPTVISAVSRAKKAGDIVPSSLTRDGCMVLFTPRWLPVVSKVEVAGEVL